MSLSGLPPELIHLIAAASMPDGFEAFMLSCKTVHEASKSLLARHNNLRRTYSRIIVDEGLTSTITLLLRISRDPLIAEYIEDLDLWNQAGLPASTSVMEVAAIQDLSWTKELGPHILQSAYWDGLEMSPEDWAHRMAAAPHAYVICIDATVALLAALPNLRHLTPTFGSQYMEEVAHETIDETDSEPKTLWEKRLDKLVIRANDAQSTSKALKNLEVVRPCFEPGYDSYGSLQTFNSFMSVPSVRTMRVASCKAVDDGYTGDPFTWISHFPSSNIERLELAYCCIDGPGIGEIVQHMPHLRILRYSHETKWHGCLHDWDAGEFVAHVGKWCGESLTTLSVTISELFGDSDGAAPFLKQFTALEHLEVDLRCLEAHESRIEGVAGPPPAAAIQPAVSLETNDAMYSLGDILPHSINSLRLFVPTSEGQHAFTQRWLSRLQPGPELPLLKHLEVCHQKQLPDEPSESKDHDDAISERLREMLPSTIEYSYSVVATYESEWQSEIYE